MTPRKTSIRPASAEALFGSAARGDADALSDRDVLIVDDDVESLAIRSADLESQGASVASYTFAKLMALVACGALFVQHLKLEAQVTRDVGGRLTKLLADFSPRADYSTEIADNAALSALAGTVPTGARGLLFAADILYVGVRNHGVLSLAERGVHVYGFDAVTAGLESEGLVAPGGARSLAALRFLKCLYRSGEAGRGNAVHDTVETALSVLPPEFFPRHIRVLAPRGIISSPHPIGAPAYLVLRDLERRLVALQELGHDPSLNADLARLARWITNPRAYALISHRIAPRIHATIEQFADECAPTRSAAG
ncbi:nucleotidyltransferase domain-containing protein [Mesorhizobium sp. M0615]|uniref:nucleotidyltransferase domain-containing protein n=1 Tax=Mesorhizobium sp. M0615 TaxID=2956971 RepID=UPI00333B02ED